MIKMAAPAMLGRVPTGRSRRMAAPASRSYAHARAMGIFDGPDEVHRNQIGRLELRKQG
jgi:acyl-CoA dehydrogenase